MWVIDGRLYRLRIMITPEEFLTRWPGRKFVRALAQAVDPLLMLNESKIFLRDAGLPKEPGLDITIDFPPERIPTLPEALQHEMELPESLKRYRRIGTDDVGLQICIDEEQLGCVVAINIKKPKRIFVNSDIPKFAECLLIYRELAKLESTGEFDDDDKTKATDKLEAQFQNIDLQALSDEDNWWPIVIEQRRDGYL